MEPNTQLGISNPGTQIGPNSTVLEEGVKGEVPKLMRHPEPWEPVLKKHASLLVINDGALRF